MSNDAKDFSRKHALFFDTKVQKNVAISLKLFQIGRNNFCRFVGFRLFGYFIFDT